MLIFLPCLVIFLKIQMLKFISIRKIIFLFCRFFSGSYHSKLPSDLLKLFWLDKKVILADRFKCHLLNWYPNNNMDYSGEILHNYYISNALEFASPNFSSRFCTTGYGTTIYVTYYIHYSYTIISISALAADVLLIQITIDYNHSIPNLITYFV